MDVWIVIAAHLIASDAPHLTGNARQIGLDQFQQVSIQGGLIPLVRANRRDHLRMREWFGRGGEDPQDRHPGRSGSETGIMNEGFRHLSGDFWHLLCQQGSRNYLHLQVDECLLRTDLATTPCRPERTLQAALSSKRSFGNGLVSVVQVPLSFASSGSSRQASSLARILASSKCCPMKTSC